MRYVFGDCEVDTRLVELVRSGCVVPVEPLVYRFLVYLIEHRDRVVSSNELLDELWTGKVVSDATLANVLKQVRQAVGDDGRSQSIIRTLRGHGYRFIAPVVLSPAFAAAPVDPALTNDQPPAVPDLPSVALLGFESFGGHDSADLFAEGLAVDLNARLARLRGLFVISRSSASRFSPRAMSLSEIAERLGVRYLIHGSSRRTSNRIRVTVDLVEASLQRSIWSEQFDRPLADVFVVQDEIVDLIVAALLPALEAAEMERARLLPTANLAAWECYYRAMWHNFRFTAKDSELARNLLLRATAIDPAFARAYAGLSFNHFLHGFLETDAHPEEHVRLALDYAHRSVGLDDRDGMTHWVLGRALFLTREHDAALRSLDRAMEINPNYAQGRYASGFIGAHSGIAGRALVDLELAQRLSPFDPLLFAMKSSRGICLAQQGRYDAAAALAVEATEVPNAHFHIHAIAGACLQLAGRDENARRAVARALALHPGYSLEVYERSFPHRDSVPARLFRDALLDAGLPRH